MSEYVLVWATGALPLLLIVAALVLLKRIADTLHRIAVTLDRRLLHLERAVDPSGEDAEGRWPPPA